MILLNVHLIMRKPLRLTRTTYYEIVTLLILKQPALSKTIKSLLYVYWQFAFEDVLVYGEHGKNISIYSKLVEILHLNTSKRLIIYVHNLGYEFQFMRKYFQWEEDGCLPLIHGNPLKPNQ